MAKINPLLRRTVTAISLLIVIVWGILAYQKIIEYLSPYFLPLTLLIIFLFAVGILKRNTITQSIKRFFRIK